VGLVCPGTTPVLPPHLSPLSHSSRAAAVDDRWIAQLPMTARAAVCRLKRNGVNKWSNASMDKSYDGMHEKYDFDSIRCSVKKTISISISMIVTSVVFSYLFISDQTLKFTFLSEHAVASWIFSKFYLITNQNLHLCKHFKCFSNECQLPSRYYSWVFKVSASCSNTELKSVSKWQDCLNSEFVWQIIPYR